MKICKKDDKGRECMGCGVYKAWEEYNKNPTQTTGRDGKCKECLKAYRRSEGYRKANKERSGRDYADPEKKAAQIERMREYYSREDIKEYRASEEFKKEERIRKSRWLEAGGEELKEKLRIVNRETQRKRALIPRNKLSAIMSCGLRKSLLGKKSRRHWEDIVGYTIDELRVHLESLFEPEMTWDNHTMDGWHIDHVIPLSAFIFEKPEDDGFRRCWALSNLAPRWGTTEIARKHGSSSIGNINKATKVL